MGNLAFVSFKKNVDLKWLHNQIDQINTDRFDGKLQIDPDYKYSVRISHPSTNHYDELNFQIESKRKISCKHPHVRWLCYVMNTIQDELAFRNNGIISDEGVSEKWKGNPNKHPTYNSWIDMFLDPNSHIGKLPKKVISELRESYMQSCPVELRNK